MTLDLRPKISDFGFEISDFQKSAAACATRATLAKVKSSAMTARQPSVPNLIWDILNFVGVEVTRLKHFLIRASSPRLLHFQTFKSANAGSFALTIFRILFTATFKLRAPIKL